MDKVIVSGDLGEIGKYEVDFRGGKLVLSLNANFGPASGNISIGVDSDAVLDAIKNAIPGKIDDAVIETLKLLLKA